ncbi:hypothetical protein BH10CYA1_BH10CYA1_21330 [soil metagenome]
MPALQNGDTVISNNASVIGTFSRGHPWARKQSHFT